MTNWTRAQKNTVLASFLGWMLDAFDFLLLVFVIKYIAIDFNTSISKISIAITLTLAMRPIGALLFGRLADHFGRKSIFILSISLYSILQFLTAFSPNLTIFLLLRTLFGIAMGGEWGVGAALTTELVPIRSRGWVSGLLQAGYPSGFLLASITFGLFYNVIGWRGLFMICIMPSILLIIIRSHLPESPIWKATQSITNKKSKPKLLAILGKHWRLVLFTLILMTLFNFFAHGSQDLYPTFLEVQHHLDTKTVSWIMIIGNIGAIAGGIICGAISEFSGRRYTIFFTALITLPILPLWAFSVTPLSLSFGVFLLQFMVQGAWGVIPAYLNELSPITIRATFPGLTYQLGNFFSCANAPLQVWIATRHNGDYSFALALIVGIVAVTLSSIIMLGPENKGSEL